jgi:carbamoyl-phosphate synthase small subunit
LRQKIKAALTLQDGSVYRGYAFGHLANTSGEVVFTTGMTGYQETFTDPSFAGQIVTMTYPLIGNYGFNLEDMEAAAPHMRGCVIREKCDTPNNWRCEMDLDGFCKQYRVTGLEGVDTRRLTRRLREYGTLSGVIRIDGLEERQYNEPIGKNLVRDVTCSKAYSLPNANARLRMAVLDFGVKGHILSELQRECALTVFPAFSTPEEVLACQPDAVFLSNGPGDPKDIPTVIESVKTLMERKPVIGICLGHQLIALASGGDTERLKFGHHGGNHPVKDIVSGRVYITSQNHNYVDCRLPKTIEVTHKNVNDGTIEGIRHLDKPVMSVQFHPEAAPGPIDTRFIFSEMLKMISWVG